MVFRRLSYRLLWVSFSWRAGITTKIVFRLAAVLILATVIILISGAGLGS